MRKHKLIELRKIIEERIGSLTEEVEIATNVKLNPLYITDRKDEIEFVRWTATIIDSILNRNNEHKQVQLGMTKMRLDLADCIEFENTLQSRVEELNLKLKNCNNLCESDILINEIDTLESIFGRLSDLKYGDKARVIERAEANNDFKRAIRLRKQLNKMQDKESEISVLIFKFQYFTSPSQLPDGVLGTNYTQQLTTVRSTGSTNFSMSTGTLPSGMTLSSAGVVSGIPSILGTFDFIVIATDVTGISTDKLCVLRVL